VDVFTVRPDANEYCGLGPEDMQPRYMCDKELTRGNSYWSDGVEAMYRDAHPENAQQQKEGILLLDAANSRVRAADNITDRALEVQRKYPRFTVIVCSGSGGMACKLSGSGSNEWLNKDHLRLLVNDPNALSLSLDSFDEKRQAALKAKPYPSVSDLLTAIIMRCGLAPIAVIGYTRLLRGESFVSSSCTINGVERRIVPTHLVCGLSPGRCVEDLVQMAGRVTFMGRNALRTNLGADAKVQIFIHFRDWDMALAYYRFQDEVCERLEAGKSMDQVMSGMAEKYSFSSNLVACRGGERARKGARSIGARKRGNELAAGFETADKVPKDQFRTFFPGRAWYNTLAYICMYIYMYIYIYTNACMHAYIYTHACLRIYTHAYMNVHLSFENGARTLRLIYAHKHIHNLAHTGQWSKNFCATTRTECRGS
jgi:hypothetical protein